MKNFFGLLLLVVAVAAIAYFAWDRSIKREVRYSKPLTTLVDHTFNPYMVQNPVEDSAKISETLQSCQKRMASTSKPSEADRMTVLLCQTLQEVRQKRVEYGARVNATREKTYGSLRGDSGSEQTKKTIINALEKQHSDYEQEQREYCQELLGRIKASQ